MAKQNNNGKRVIEEQSAPAKIMLSFKSQDETEAYYRCVCDKKIRYLLQSFCKDNGLDYQTVVFLFDGKRVNSNRTPFQLGMEDGDTIDVMLHQDGGCLIEMDI
ncbi:hypothetical protein ACP275_07G081700 [Erythranthe tilingii]